MALSTGLVSGFDYGSFIDQMMAIESRPKTMLQTRNATLTTQTTALQTLNAKLLSLKLDANSLTQSSNFKLTSASSSNDSVLTASSGSSAVPGSYSFTVAQLVSSQQSVTRGFADQDAIAVGAATLTFEPQDASLTHKTMLADLNGGAGVARGSIRITDRSGTSATIDLSRALTVDDVVNAINSVDSVGVRASINEHGLVLTDTTGETAANLAVKNVGLTQTASELGLAQSVAASTLAGSDINTLSEDSQLAGLNDGLGIRTRAGLNDFRITARDGTQFSVNLDDASTLGDVLDAINTAGGGKVTASINDDQRSLKLTDNTGGSGTLLVEARNNSMAAADLGIDGGDTNDDGVLHGNQLIASINSKLLKNLNGGTGIGASRSSIVYSDATLSTPVADLFNGAGLDTNGNSNMEFVIHVREGVYYSVNLDGVTTVGDLINRVETSMAGKVTVSLEDNKLRLSDNTTGSGDFRIWQHPDNTAGTQLGWAGTFTSEGTVLGADLSPVPVVAPPGGPGSINVTTRDGATTAIDLNDAQSVSDVLRLINNSGAGVTAAINTAGNGFVITDNTTGSGNLTISDVDKRAAELLSINGIAASGAADSGNLQLAYINEQTTLDSLAITRGKFTITDSDGKSATVDLTQGNENTLQDVIDEINSRGIAVNARINDNGDGLLLEDTGSGGLAITVAEEGSTTAKTLGLLGAAANAGDDLDGSFEKTVAIDADDTLTDVRDKINDAGIGIKASIISDGSSANPYRLSFAATTSGTQGAFLFDDGALDLKTSTLNEARDAVVFYGGGAASSSVMITSKTNTLENVIPGATITLKSTSTSPVTVSISRDTSKVADIVKRFVDSFNAVITLADQYDSYDADTEKRGVLLGDSGVLQVRSSMYNAVIGRDNDLKGRYNSLSQIGIKVGSGASLTFDSAKFNEAMATDPDAVMQLFTFKETTTEDGKETYVKGGIGADINRMLERLTAADSGALESRVTSINRQIELNNDRIDQYDQQLEAKRARLEAQFIAMEEAIAQMQAQSNSIAGLAGLSNINSSSS